jgi:hypothetical protein
MTAALCALFQSTIHVLKALPDICINTFPKNPSEQSIEQLALDKVYALRLQLLDNENVLSV